MASMVTNAKMPLTHDLEIPVLEPLRASAKSKETKEVGLGLDDPTKTVKIGVILTPNRKARLSPSYVPTPTCLLRNLQTCRGYHGRRSNTP